MATTQFEQNELINNQAPTDRGKDKRLSLNYSVEIKGFDRAGRLFAAHVRTEDISESGCRIQTPLHLEPGDVITIKLDVPSGRDLPEEMPQLFEIVWVTRDENSSTAGARKIQDGKLWKVSFPPSDCFPERSL